MHHWWRYVRRGRKGGTFGHSLGVIQWLWVRTGEGTAMCSNFCRYRKWRWWTTEVGWRREAGGGDGGGSVVYTSTGNTDHTFTG